MNTTTHAKRPLSWPLIVGLSSLALLWPLTGLWPILGEGPVRAFTLLGLTGAVWIGTVGFARIARPVLTLTICGAAHGVLTLALGGLLAGTGAIGAGPAMLMAFIPSLAMGAGVGALAGLAAAGIQAMLGRREER
ncbi:hypothetical protein [Brevibacterium spongiae]|uniref:DUF4175 domain-containing protein n=1 Tax=Brevibacterium spongiae TaxID=2909672 RepID=A0ABY5SUY7_9MICO|nr:hypothetical protein [Brevibacterium spongiae]UVI36879.1 hypothetical protein L1F31_04275 [Brevibacterium spongiae]